MRNVIMHRNSVSPIFSSEIRCFWHPKNPPTPALTGEFCYIGNGILWRVSSLPSKDFLEVLSSPKKRR